MPRYQPTTALFEQALENDLPMSPATLAAALDLLRGMDTEELGLPLDVGRLYSRPELSAAQAATLKARFLARFTHGMPRELETEWAVRTLLRPESQPQHLTRADVEALPADVRDVIANWCRWHPVLVPGELAQALAQAPDLDVAARAAQHPSARHLGSAVVDRVHAALADVPDLDEESAQSVKYAVAATAGWSAPAATATHAALTWTHPQALSRIDPKHLSGDALERLVQLWLLPHLSSGSDALEECVGVLFAVLRTGEQQLKVAVHRAWMDSGAFERFDTLCVARDERETALDLRARFAEAGLPLRRPLMSRPFSYASVHALGREEQAELFAVVNARSEQCPQLWTSLNLLLDTPDRVAALVDCTWAGLIDAAAAAAANPDQG